MTPPVEPEDDIGPVYQLLGAVCLFGGILFGGFHAFRGSHMQVYDFGIITVLIVAAMALLRPKWLDGFVKTIADKLPFLAFKKPE